MPSNISKARLSKAFNEGRRSATVEAVENPYDNPKLRALWEKGREQQRSGELKTPIPALEHGERRAERVPQNPPGSRRTRQQQQRPPGPRPRGGGGGGGYRGGGGGYRGGGGGYRGGGGGDRGGR